MPANESLRKQSVAKAGAKEKASPAKRRGSLKLENTAAKEAPKAAIVRAVIEGKEWKERSHWKKRKGVSPWRKNHSGFAFPIMSAKILPRRTERGITSDRYQILRLFFSFLMRNLM
jgi:hypothetical protein